MSETNNKLSIDDAELDAMLKQWAEAEVELPEGFHESVMTRLRAKESQKAPQKKGAIISLAERFANKKAWVPVVTAAALVLCCLPVLQNHQESMSDINNSASQVYEMKSRSMDQEGSAEPQLMTTSLMDTEAVGIPAYNTNAAMAKTAATGTDTFDYDRAEMTPEEQLVLAQDNLAELEAHLSALDDSAEAQALREELQIKIDALKVEIKALEEQIAAAELGKIDDKSR